MCMCVLSCVWSLQSHGHGIFQSSSSVHGIFQTTILEWGVISSSRRSSCSRDQTHISCVFCTGRWILYHWSHLWSQAFKLQGSNKCIQLSLFKGIFFSPWSDPIKVKCLSLKRYLFLHSLMLHLPNGENEKNWEVSYPIPITSSCPYPRIYKATSYLFPSNANTTGEAYTFSNCSLVKMILLGHFSLNHRDKET